MSVRQLIELAGGLLESSSGINAEITRQIFDHEHNSIQEHIAIDLRQVNEPLRIGDSLTVKQIPYYNERKQVELLGEVVSPGTYSILPGETLTSVIERAGGLTPSAYIEGTTYSREDLRQLEREQLSALRDDVQKEITGINLNNSVGTDEISDEQADQILESIENVDVKGLLVINLRDILTNPNTYDFELEDGDIIEVPSYKPTVTVVGEVQQSTSHFFDPKMSLKDYIQSSGGTKETADEKRIFVVHANGQIEVQKKSAWFRKTGLSMRPGDTIVVPIDADKVDQLEVWSSITQIISQTAFGIAAINNL